VQRFKGLRESNLRRTLTIVNHPRVAQLNDFLPVTWETSCSPRYRYVRS